MAQAQTKMADLRAVSQTCLKAVHKFEFEFEQLGVEKMF